MVGRRGRQRLQLGPTGGAETRFWKLLIAAFGTEHGILRCGERLPRPPGRFILFTGMRAGFIRFVKQLEAAHLLCSAGQPNSPLARGERTISTPAGQCNQISSRSGDVCIAAVVLLSGDQWRPAPLLLWRVAAIKRRPRVIARSSPPGTTAYLHLPFCRGEKGQSNFFSLDLGMLRRE